MMILVALAGCGGPPRSRETAPALRLPGPPGTGRLVAEHALSYVGTPYRYGGADRSGIDCSGLVYRIFLDLGYALPRTAAEQSRYGMPVSWSELLAGDLVFFRTSGRKPSHVGIYIADGEFVHAPGSGDRVKMSRLDSSYFRKRFAIARRMVHQ
jgi:cell wall-associated NlpC family hydrolase